MSSAIITSALPVFEALRLIASSDAPLSTADISRAMKLPTSTVHRFLVTLEQTGYVARYAGSPKFIPGNMPQHLCRALFNRFPLCQIGYPYLRRLAKLSHETVTLMVRVGFCGLRVEVIGDAAYLPEMTGGTLLPLHETLEGRGILSFLPEPDIQKYRNYILTGSNCSSKPNRNLWRKLREFRAREFATAPLRYSDNQSAIALPIRKAGNGAVAAFGVFGPVLASKRSRNTPLLKSFFEVRSQIESALDEYSDDALSPFSHWSSNPSLPKRHKPRMRSTRK